MSRWRYQVVPGALCFSALLSATPAVLSQDYPTKPVRMIVPYSPGGSGDIVARIVAQKLPEFLGQPVVIDNRAGAGGLIGTDTAAKSAPDGYTLLLTGTTHVILPQLYRKIPFDALKDFAPIMQFGGQPYVLAVHPSIGVTTVKDLIALAQKQPGRINYASSGNGGAQHLFAALFASMAKIDIVHVPYKGSGPARADLLGGQIKVSMLGIASVLANHKAGQVRILAVTSAERSPEIPDIPSIAETLPGYNASVWQGLTAPRGTPRAVIERIYRDVTRTMGSPDVKAAFERVGYYVVTTNPKAFGDLLRLELDQWGKVAREINLQAD